MVDSPREIVGAVLKCMGASYNTHNITSQVAGGKDALQDKLSLFAKQVKFDMECINFALIFFLDEISE